ncbi:AraC family transcriptional regulator [Ihubacter massiliensis]|uniref:AraC family transcriptional regulator n=1 Tax=Hominibacterium faecale TaxID=2839743 RepID=A0A9J6QMZ7_9FIRM|nr:MULTISPECIES: AraC family transcriptional regulator [Eubacteriales Family XIII. Incertae Sedis]MCO7121565.1 AraC family transcriptional regulator [Ihubacter massiliensis]MCU7378545.1 AraC family transcriptional regulator [Hominibacterium faecale]
MLLESINYLEELPASIEFQSVLEEPYHYHKELELVLVLRGTTSLKVRHSQYKLSEGDLILIDMRDLHQFYNATEDILTVVMHLDAACFSHLYPDIEIMVFTCEECSEAFQDAEYGLKNKVELLKHVLGCIMLETAKEKKNRSYIMEMLERLVHTLVKEFQGFYIENHCFKVSQETAKELDIKRAYQIIKYIGQNYENKISLQEAAEHVYLSPYYVSHLLKRITGLNFQTFVNYIRMEYAEVLLLESNLPLTQVSEFCGFSSPGYFSHFFKEWHKATPAKYKEQFKIKKRKQLKVQEDQAMRILMSRIPSLNSRKADSLAQNMKVNQPDVKEMDQGKNALFQEDRMQKLFPENLPSWQREEYVIEALEYYKKYRWKKIKK